MSKKQLDHRQNIFKKFFLLLKRSKRQDLTQEEFNRLLKEQMLREAEKRKNYLDTES